MVEQGEVLRVDNGAIHFSVSAGGAENTHERELIIEQGGATLALGMAPRQNPTITWAGPISGTGDLLINNATQVTNSALHLCGFPASCGVI